MTRWGLVWFYVFAVALTALVVFVFIDLADTDAHTGYCPGTSACW